MSQLSFSAPATRESSLRDWARRHLGSLDHELRVARLARTLFQLTRPWHALAPADARLLTLAALVHDVGRAGGPRKHERRGARMLLKTRWLPLDPAERRRLAYLTRFHKGPVPRTWEDGILDWDEDHAPTLRTLLGLLRAADSLDSRSLGAPRLILDRATRDRRLLVTGYVDDVDQAQTVYAQRKKFRLLEETLDCRVHTEWFATRHFAKVS